MLAQMPDVRLVARKARAVNAALLARAHADDLPALGVAYRVGLRIFQCDKAQKQIALLLFGERFVFGDDVRERFRAEFRLVASLLEGDAEHVLVLDGRRRVRGGLSAQYCSRPCVLLSNGQRGLGIARRDDAVRHLMLDHFCRGLVAFVGRAIQSPKEDILSAPRARA